MARRSPMLRLAVLLAMLAAAALLPAQEHPIAVIPDTPAGRMFQSWLASFNSGDRERHVRLIAEHYSDTILAGHTPEEAADAELRMRQEVGGGFDVFKVPQGSSTEVTVVLREHGGFGFEEIFFRVEPAKPTKVVALRLRALPTPPEAQPPRLERQQLAREFDKVLQGLADDDRFSGAALIAKDGKPIFEKAYGYADREKLVANRPDTRFNVGSISKAFTSVALGQLVAQGKLKYTDTVGKLLPDYPNKDAAPILLHQLLTHTSGLGSYFGPAYEERRDWLKQLKDYLPLFADKPLDFPPGTRFRYSNAGYIVAGLLVEKASGQGYHEYVRQRVFQPAGMASTDNYEKTAAAPNLAVGYSGPPGRLEPNTALLPARGNSAGGAYSTAGDLARFAQALRSHRFFGPEMTTMLTTGKVDMPTGNRYAYGFYESTVDGKRLVSHGGGAPGISAWVDLYWDSGYVVVILANRDQPIADKLAGWVRDRIKQ